MSEDDMLTHLAAVYAPIAALFSLGLWVGLRGRRATGAARARALAPPLPPHVGTYRTNPRQQPTLPRRTPWWRLALWWAKGGPRRLEAARRRRDPWRELRHRVERIGAKLASLQGAALRSYDEDISERMQDGRMLMRWASRRERASTDVDCPTCCAVAGEPCCPNEH